MHSWLHSSAWHAAKQRARLLPREKRVNVIGAGEATRGAAKTSASAAAVAEHNRGSTKSAAQYHQYLPFTSHTP